MRASRPTKYGNYGEQSFRHEELCRRPAVFILSGEEMSGKARFYTMALTRKALTAMGLTAEQVDSIIEMHTETVDGLKAYKADAEKLPEVQRQLDEANQKLEAAGEDDYKVKYDALVAENQQREVRTAKEAALKGLLGELGISDRGQALALKYTNLDTVELDSAGKLANGAAVKEAVLADWGDYKGTVTEKGASVAAPPNGGGGNPSGMTKEQILAIRDGAARRQAMAENPTLFGLPANNS